MTIHTSESMNAFEPDTHTLQDKIILITGAGDGIGKAAALAFANCGATVILLGKTLAKLEMVYDEIEANNAPQPAIYPMNFEGSTEHDFDMLRDTIENEFGRLDGILHNAAELGPRTPIANYSVTEWCKLFTVNITAPFMLTKALLPELEKSNNASILFTDTAVANKGQAFWGAHSVSKAASNNFMEVLADELDGTSTIRANAINPGAVRTRMRAAAFPAEDPMTVVTPSEVMNAYIFLMSDKSIGINGQRFNAQDQSPKQYN